MNEKKLKTKIAAKNILLQTALKSNRFEFAIQLFRDEVELFDLNNLNKKTIDTIVSSCVEAILKNKNFSNRTSFLKFYSEFFARIIDKDKRQFYINTIYNKVSESNIDKIANISILEKLLFFIPEHKITDGNWCADVNKNPSNKICLAAGHVNRVTGTMGYNKPPIIIYNGKEHTTEAVLTKIVVDYMVDVGLQRNFCVIKFMPTTEDFKTTILEYKNYCEKYNMLAFEIHSDAPTEGSHRALNYDGHTGIIPPVNCSIFPAIASLGDKMGKFQKGWRDLFAPKHGITLVELFPTNKEVTEAIYTKNYNKLKSMALPYINLFYDALKDGGIKQN